MRAASDKDSFSMKEDDLVRGVVAVAREAGSFIRAQGQNFSYSNVETKGLNDLVSYVDRESENIIVRGLRELVPDAGFITEEGTAMEKKSRNWIIDPLDGTTNFIHGVPCYAVSIALETDGQINVGVVLEISRDECFWAYRGGGAYLNGARIMVSGRKELSEALLGTGFPIYNFARMPQFLSALEHFMRNTHGVRRIGAAAADLCYLAAGRLDAFFEYNLNPWDVAAGALIVTEAGGSVCDFSGGENWLFGKEIACTNGLLHDEFLGVVKEKFRLPA